MPGDAPQPTAPARHFAEITHRVKVRTGDSLDPGKYDDLYVIHPTGGQEDREGRVERYQLPHLPGRSDTETLKNLGWQATGNPEYTANPRVLRIPVEKIQRRGCGTNTVPGNAVPGNAVPGDSCLTAAFRLTQLAMDLLDQWKAAHPHTADYRETEASSGLRTAAEHLALLRDDTHTPAYLALRERALHRLAE